MKQYFAIKAKHPGALLLFRVGDFYETFGDDAIRASKILGIVLTQRKNGAASHVELAGFPHHSLDVYLPKLVRAGERVAICDQLEDPKTTKTIVKRGVTELVTPGVLFNETILDGSRNNFLATVHFSNNGIGLAFLDVSTGEFIVCQGNLAYAEQLMSSFSPSEVIFERSMKVRFQESFGQKFHTYHLDEWVFQPEFAADILTNHFKTHSLKGFGIESLNDAIVAAGAALHYLGETQHHRLSHINHIRRIDRGDYMWLDRFTQRNLELFQPSNENGRSLLDVLDHTATPMGSRLLKQWLAFPLVGRDDIRQRQDSVEFFIHDGSWREITKSSLRKIGDLERMVSRLSIGKLGPKEALSLANSIEEAQKLSGIHLQSECIDVAIRSLKQCVEAKQLIRKSLHPDAPSIASKGMVIANGINEELDDLRIMAFSGKDYLIKIQDREARRTGITSLKIGYNNVFGYFLEVTNAHKEKVPGEWIRKQTLVNAERYITEELKEYEQKILGAEERIYALEQELYGNLLLELSRFVHDIQDLARSLAELDILSSFAQSAIGFNYCRPAFLETTSIEITEGRHPVIEQEMQLGETYIANDIVLNQNDQQIVMLTGPNMSGKSALLRQCALISVMAQIGSYVPAKSAKLTILEKLFTRVGASDNISQGESTFMVEMNETASILNNLSTRSLILLDEIGRGTSTYDGISIAWSIAEYLHQHASRPLTLFATHYHELNEMSARFERIKNYTISIRETKDKVIFLRKLIPGGSEHSFGIHVAKMAGMPDALVKRAQSILVELESGNRKSISKEKLHALKDDVQLSFFQLDDPVLSQIRQELITIDINSLTPVEALFKLNEIKKLLGARV